MGNPFEENYYYEGWRDTGQAEGRPMDVVHDPAQAPECESPETTKMLDCLFARIKRELASLVVFTKRPAFVEPPFFSKPLIKAKSGLEVAAGNTGTIFEWDIKDRQKIMVVMLGMDMAPIAPLLAGQLEFWFQAGSDIIPVFDDQTPTYYGGSSPIQSGKTTVLPGSVENPFCFPTNGLAFGVKGPRVLQFNVHNRSGVTVTFRGVMGFYQYWMAAKAGSAQFEGQDLQV